MLKEFWVCIKNKIKEDGMIILFLYQDFLKQENLLLTESFDYDGIDFQNDSVNYKGNSYKNIIFAINEI